MTPEEMVQTISSRFESLYTETDKAYDNQNYVPVIGNEFVRLSITQTTGVIQTIGPPGDRRFRKFGICTIQVFTPVNKGSKRNTQLCQTVLNIFDGVGIGDLRFFDGGIETIGQSVDWFQQNVNIQFSYDEIK